MENKELLNQIIDEAKKEAGIIEDNNEEIKVESKTLTDYEKYISNYVEKTEEEIKEKDWGFVVVTDEPTDVESWINYNSNKNGLSSEELVNRLVEEANEGSLISLDLETQGLDEYSHHVLLVQISSLKNNYVFKGIEFDKWWDKIRPLIANPKIVTLGHNLAFDSKFFLHRYGIFIRGAWDTMLVEASLCLGKQVGSYSPQGKFVTKNLDVNLEAVSLRRLGIQLDKPVRKSFIGMPIEAPFTSEQIEYASSDTDVLLEIYEQQKVEVEAHGEKFRRVIWIENNVMPITAQMEHEGFKVDLPKLYEYTVETQIDILNHLDALYEAFKYRIVEPEPPVFKIKKDGTPFKKQPKPIPFYHPVKERGARDLIIKEWEDKLVSTEDSIIKLQEIITTYTKDTLNLRSPKNIVQCLKEMNIEDLLGYQIESTGKDELEQIEDELNEVNFDTGTISSLLKFRKSTKMLDGFLYKIPTFINPISGKLHSHYTQLPVRSATGSDMGASTGRFACSGPNFQQMPKIKALRSVYGSENEDDAIITIDYSAFEVRILGNVVNDSKIIDFFSASDIENLPKGPDNNPIDSLDFHGYCASLVFEKPIEMVAKRINIETGKEFDPIIPELRPLSKVASFACYYGCKPWVEFTDKETGKTIKAGLYLKLRVSKDRATEIVDSYHEKFNVTISELERIAEDGWDNEIIYSPCGRIKYMQKKYLKKGRAFRMIKNFVIQSPNSVACKYGMYLINKNLPDVKIRAQIHDELVCSCHKDIAEERAKQIKEYLIIAAQKVLPGPISYDADFKIEKYWTK